MCTPQGLADRAPTITFANINRKSTCHRNLIRQLLVYMALMASGDHSERIWLHGQVFAMCAGRPEENQACSELKWQRIVSVSVVSGHARSHGGMVLQRCSTGVQPHLLRSAVLQPRFHCIMFYQACRVDIVHPTSRKGSAIAVPGVHDEVHMPWL